MLGIPKDASKSDIKKAYFKKAKQFHPDTNADDPEAAKKFGELAEAYEVLSDGDKRKVYDTYGHQGLEGGGGGGFGGFQGFQGGGQPSACFTRTLGPTHADCALPRSARADAERVRAGSAARAPAACSFCSARCRRACRMLATPEATRRLGSPAVLLATLLL